MRQRKREKVVSIRHNHGNHSAIRSESYDEDEEYDNPEIGIGDDGQNSALAVGYKSDRSFVVRGDKIGVFKHTQDDGLGNRRLTSQLTYFQNIRHLLPTSRPQKGNPSCLQRFHCKPLKRALII